MTETVVMNLKQAMEFAEARKHCLYCKGDDFSDKTDTCVTCGAPRAKAEDYGRIEKDWP